jgi:uncharacterized membrane protein YkoI
MKRQLLIIGLLSVLLGSAPLTMSAEPAISKSQAASIAAAQYPGKIINVSLSNQDSTPVYRVKVLDSKGGMHIVTIDGSNGNVLSAH